MDPIFLGLVYLWSLLWEKRNVNAIHRRRIRRYKTRPVFRQRHLGEMRMINELYQNDAEMFKKSFRMTSFQFDYLLTTLGPSISTTREAWNDSISPRQRLAMTLRLV
jgi:hypothetical protein